MLGVPLKRLTFGHVVLLERFGCNPVRTTIDLATAVQICSRDFKGALRFVDGLGSFGSKVRMWLFMRRVRKWDIAAAAKAWREYVDENSHAPEFATQSGQGVNKCGAPTIAQIRVYLLRFCGYSPDTILEQPYGQCLWDFAAAREQVLGEGIIGDKHEEIFRLLNNG